jgi:small nuclear ribonucleoprotein (snRNP)-like protein
MKKQFYFTILAGLCAMCLLSVSCKKDSDKTNNPPSITISVNNNSTANNATVPFNKATVDPLLSDSIVTLSLTIKKGTNDVQYVGILVNNDYESNIFLTDVTNKVWNGIEAGKNPAVGSAITISFVGVNATYTITVVDSKNYPTSVSFTLSGSETYSFSERSLSNIQLLKFDSNQTLYEKTALGLTFNGRQETADGINYANFQTADGLCQISAEEYANFGGLNYELFRKNAALKSFNTKFSLTDKTLSSPVYLLYKNDVYYYLLKLLSVQDNIAVLEFQY